jgi:hypothetical protein
MVLALILAVFTTGRALWSYFVHDPALIMIPDFGLYAQGGFGLYPSPVGRALGAFGPEVFAAVSALSAGAVVLLVAVLARQAAGSPGWAAAAGSSMPAALYLGYAGIDPIGLALLLGSVAARPGYRGARSSAGRSAGLRTAPVASIFGGRAVLAVLAGLTHLSLAPFALLLLPRATWPARLALGLFAAILTGSLLLTPYSGIIYGAFRPDALTAGALGLLAFAGLALPALILGRWNRLVGLALLVGLAECVAQAHLQARYLLPAAFLMAASMPAKPHKACRRHLALVLPGMRRFLPHRGNGRVRLWDQPGPLRTVITPSPALETSGPTVRLADVGNATKSKGPNRLAPGSALKRLDAIPARRACPPG